ncbi:hypothetical protein MKK58_04390 [Methylobacterium sp. J-078]|uniref:hypothetical protein n=1 Tax=Methylobacterium sp. J-078 TaxID=2836657 RepID=UPI001FBB776F|nr:hypothetical protein [Methylobacterium sp. J-078]MCJ2043776.1 hypothetical protein [Methylobacterium sp. J-078]
MDLRDAIGSQRVGRYWLWSEAEIALLRSGQPIPHRTARACKYKRLDLGIRIRPIKYLSKNPYKPPKQVLGDIPWPSWWRRAHLMRVEGYSPLEIARILIKDIKAVRAALYPSEREKRRQRNLRLRQKVECRAKQQERDKAREHDREKDKLRSIARFEWRAAGGDPRALERFYRAYDCL